MRSPKTCLVAAMLVFLAMAPIAVAKTGRSKPGASYPQALRKLDAELRIAIEQGPTALAHDVESSKEVCREAMESQQSGDQEGAERGWTTLAQIVKQVDLPVWRAIIATLRDAHSNAESIQRTFSKQWRGEPLKVNRLNLGAVRTQHGIRQFLAAIRKLEGAMDSWEQHDCAGAQQAIDATNQASPPAVQAIEKGMAILKTLD